MTEYIEREALKSKLKNMEATSPNKVYQNAMEDMIYYFIPKIIDEIPSADVAPVRHGRWLNFYGDFQTAECSQCGECYEVSDIDNSELNGEAAKMLFNAFADSYHYCPNCGARMDGKIQ